MAGDHVSKNEGSVVTRRCPSTFPSSKARNLAALRLRIGIPSAAIGPAHGLASNQGLVRCPAMRSPRPGIAGLGTPASTPESIPGNLEELGWDGAFARSMSCITPLRGAALHPSRTAGRLHVGVPIVHQVASARSHDPRRARPRGPWRWVRGISRRTPPPTVSINVRRGDNWSAPPRRAAASPA